MTEITQNGVFPDGSIARTQLFYPGTTNGRMLRKDIVPHADALALAFALEFHRPLYATDGARDYATQVRLKKEKGPFAATPGTSNHGWAKAVDFASNINKDTSAEHRWMEANGPKFGFVNPDWAKNSNPADGQYEPWHWEYVGGGADGPRVLPAAKGEMGLGWTGDLVKRYQAMLDEHVPFKVAADGQYGFMTGVAVVIVQKKAGIPLTGRMTPATKRFLLGRPDATPSKPAAPSKPTPVKRAPSRLPTISKGSKSAWVPVVQRLVGAGDDGVFGDGTESKVKAFQKRHGLKVHGVVDLRTWTQFLYGHALKRGDKGDRVKVLQNMVGLTGKDADGEFGAKTHGRVVEVQRHMGVGVDGVAGPAFRTGYLKHFKA